MNGKALCTAILASLLTLSTAVAPASETDAARFRVNHTGIAAGSMTDSGILDRARETVPVIGPARGPAEASGDDAGSGTARNFTNVSTEVRTPADLWISPVETRLFHDEDHDGFFHALTLRFTPFADHGHLHVVADVYLRYEGGPWELHAVTGPFTVHDDPHGDEHVIGTILDLGFPRGYYDVLIEFHDAQTGYWLNGIGPADSAALQALPLEDRERDSPPVVVVTAVHGGGAFGPATLLLLLLGTGMSVLRRTRERGRPPRRVTALHGQPFDR